MLETIGKIWFTTLEDLSRNVDEFNKKIFADDYKNDDEDDDKECAKCAEQLISIINHHISSPIPSNPAILRLIYQDTHTVVKWSDGTTTVVNAREGEKFDEEVGLAMAIAKKYFEYDGFNPHPRAEMLRTIKNAERYTKKENR